MAKGVKYSEEVREFIRNNSEQMTVAELKEKTGASYWFIYKLIRSDGLKSKIVRMGAEIKKQKTKKGFFNVEKNSNWLV